MTTVEEWATLIPKVAAQADWGRRSAPRRVILGNSTIDWSNPCEGILGVELKGFDFAGENFPNQDQPRARLAKCQDDIWVARWDVIIVRCADTFEGSPGGAAATPDQLNASGLGLLQDVHAIWKKLRTHKMTGDDWDAKWGLHRVVVGGFRPLVRQGGASGYAITLNTKVEDCPT